MATPYPPPSVFTDGTGRPVAEGSWLAHGRWPIVWEHEPETIDLYSCYIWRLDRTPTEGLVLVAYGEEKRLEPTQERLSCLIAYSPAQYIHLHDYPLEWSRWLESGAGVKLISTDMRRNLHLAVQYRGRYGGGGMTLESIHEEFTPEIVRVFLMHHLYYYLHPRKSDAQHEMSQVVLDSAVEKFVRAMVKREAAGLSSLAARRKK